MLALIRCIVAAVLTATAAAQTYFVDGVTGSDLAGTGASSAPWRTIAHALTQITPPASGAAILQIVGSQTYSASTNGEVFPLAVPPRVALRAATGGNAAELAPTTGTNAIRLDDALDYPGDYLFASGLHVSGGAVAVECGAAPNGSHRLVLGECAFTGQSVAGIAASSTNAQLALVLSDCTFTGVAPARGVVATNNLGGNQTIDISRSVFTGLATGIDASSAFLSPTGAQLDVALEACNIANCGIGIAIQAPSLGPGYNAVIGRSSITDCSTGIDVRDGSGPGSNTMSVEECAILRCGSGLHAHSALGMSAQSTTVSLQHCTIAACDVGSRIDAWTHESKDLQATDSTWSANTTGIKLYGSTDYTTLGMALSRCRILQGTTGIDAYCHTDSGHLQLTNCLVAQCLGHGIAYSAFGGQPGYPSNTRATLRHLTIADCGTGLEVGALPFSFVANSMAFSNNGVDTAGLATVGGSITDSAPLSGAANLTAQNLLLLRPSYKPLPASPCVDAGTSSPSTPATDYEGDPRPAPGTPADLGADEYYPQGSIRTYGTSSTGARRWQTSVGPVGSAAPLGSSIPLTMTLAPAPAGAAFGVLAIGFEDGLPLELLPLAPGNLLQVNATALAPPSPVTSNGTAQSPLDLPALPWLAGFSLHASMRGSVASIVEK